jgi:hypothetical protein
MGGRWDTHDIVFLVALTDFAEKHEVNLLHQSLHRGSTVAGLCESGPPFDGMRVKDRIGYIKVRFQEAKKRHKENKPNEYKQFGQHIYGHLRQAWERAVEEILLNEVVLRFRKSIETNRAKKIGDITPDDCKRLEDGMTKCSTWEGGHDHAPALGSAFPDPDEIEQDLKALEDWIGAIRNRRK